MARASGIEGGIVTVTDYLKAFDFKAAAAANEAAKKRAEVDAARDAFYQRGPGHAETGNGWAKPEPLPDSLKPVEPFDMALLPGSLQPWAQDIANRVQCPPDFIGATIIGALGIVIGRRVGVRPKLRDDWTEYGNQWVKLVGRPGVLKSPAMNAVLAPVKRIDLEASQRFENELALHESEAKVRKMRQDAAEKKAMATLKKNPDAVVNLHEAEALEPPKLTRYLVNDATVEKLGEICADNPQGVGVFRDELVSLLKGLDRDGQESARGFYLTGWNGNDGYVVDRIMRGHQRIEAVCLSLIGSTQPGRLSEYLRSAVAGGAADDGLVQRFGVLVWPDVPRQTWENVDCWPDAEAKHTAHAVFQRLIDADPVETWLAEVPTGPNGEPDGNPPFLRLGDEAASMFVEWRTELENELRAGDLHPAMESHLAKYRKLIPSLALIFHLADGGAGPIAVEPMARALAWSVYLRSHAERAYGSVLLAEMEGAKALLKRIKAGDIGDAFAARDVYHAKHWARLENAESVGKAISVLIEFGYLLPETLDTGGRRKTVYRINPEVLP
ncbi:YfjI family protein [Paraburkholderia pallida]|nr:YfjI family protein [Paraburkholderia pallida]